MEERKRRDCIHYHLCALRFAEEGIRIPNCPKYIDKTKVEVKKDACGDSRCGSGSFQNTR